MYILQQCKQFVVLYNINIFIITKYRTFDWYTVRQRINLKYVRKFRLVQLPNESAIQEQFLSLRILIINNTRYEKNILPSKEILDNYCLFIDVVSDKRMHIARQRNANYILSFLQRKFNLL